MSKNPTAQDYVIFHPPRKGYQAEGESLAGSGFRPWKGVVWTDPWRQKAQSNEDPFVWDGDMWLYSYCHASQLRRKPDGWRNCAASANAPRSTRPSP